MVETSRDFYAGWRKQSCGMLLVSLLRPALYERKFTLCIMWYVCEGIINWLRLRQLSHSEIFPSLNCDIPGVGLPFGCRGYHSGGYMGRVPRSLDFAIAGVVYFDYWRGHYCYKAQQGHVHVVRYSLFAMRRLEMDQYQRV